MPEVPDRTRQWILANAPTADVVLSGESPTFLLQDAPIPKLKEDQVLLKVLYLSNDPAQRPWIDKNVDPKRLYTTPVVPGDVMRAFGIGEVVASTSDRLPVGTVCIDTPGWAEYVVLPAKECRPLDPIPGLSLTHYLGAFGATGMTAYYGIKIIGELKPEDTLVVSGAAGATGSMVVQIAKHLLGCKRIIGIAGTPEKCRWVESLGAEICINYKDADFKDQLCKATDGFVEIYFDNVGGGILDLMLTRIKNHGRIIACGAVTDYNSEDNTGLKNWFEIIMQRIQVRGFIVTDFFNSGKAPEAVKELVQAFKDGKIKIGEDSETVVETKFEDVPKTWLKLYSGGNTGKLITKMV